VYCHGSVHLSCPPSFYIQILSPLRISEPKKAVQLKFILGYLALVSLKRLKFDSRGDRYSVACASFIFILHRPSNFFEFLLFYSYAICPLYINLLYNLPPYGIIEWSLQQAAMLIFYESMKD